MIPGVGGSSSRADPAQLRRWINGSTLVRPRSRAGRRRRRRWDRAGYRSGPVGSGRRIVCPVFL